MTSASPNIKVSSNFLRLSKWMSLTLQFAALTEISQGNVATCLRCGKIFNSEFFGKFTTECSNKSIF